MKVINRGQVDVGYGRPDQILRALEKEKIPFNARVVGVTEGQKWVNGPSTSGYTLVVYLDFEWESTT